MPPLACIVPLDCWFMPLVRGLPLCEGVLTVLFIPEKSSSGLESISDIEEEVLLKLPSRESADSIYHS